MAIKKYIGFDWAMKQLLRQKDNFDVLEGFLSELLKEDVRIQSIGGKREDINFSQTHEDDLFNRADILAINSKNELMLIELQSSCKRNYLLGMLCGLSKTIVDHIETGKDYVKIKKVYSVHILYFDMDNGKDYIYRANLNFNAIHQNDAHQSMPTQDKYLIHGHNAKPHTAYYLIRLNNFNDQPGNTLDQWIYFLKESEIPDDFNAKGLDKARKILDLKQMNEYEFKRYKSYLSFTQSEIQKRLGALMIGLELADEVRKLKGTKEGNVAIVRSCLRKGLNIQTICDIIELPEEQVRNMIAQAD
jgi:predicted transposase/invertase (TIGR01784 family)